MSPSWVEKIVCASEFSPTNQNYDLLPLFTWC